MMMNRELDSFIIVSHNYLQALLIAIIVTIDLGRTARLRQTIHLPDDDLTLIDGELVVCPSKENDE